ncbi:MAG: hypothetical protein EBS53_14645 [Bacteroidetes bacterium]|nr:hypothetical protein [Bacteroidota bacterium]
MVKANELRRGKNGALDAGRVTIGAERMGVLPCASGEQGEYYLDPKIGTTERVTTEVTTEVATEVTTEVTGEVTTEVTTEVAGEVATEVATEVKKLVSLISGEHSSKELKVSLLLKNDEHFRKQYVKPALEQGLIEMTIPDKPNSSKQKYRLTGEGMELFKRIADKMPKTNV